jgi:hypothetical protein
MLKSGIVSDAFNIINILPYKKKHEVLDCLNDTLTNPCGQKFAKTTLPSNTENISNVGSNEKNSSGINTTDVDFLFADTDEAELQDVVLIRRWSFVKLVKNIIF